MHAHAVSKKVELLKQVNELSAVRNDLASEVMPRSKLVCMIIIIYVG